MTTHANIRICLVEGALRQRALDFIHEQYRLSFGTTPTDEPDILFAACQDIDIADPPIVGTIGISLSEPNRPIRLARIYRFDPNALPRSSATEAIFEYERLIARRRGISKALIAVASQHALSIGRTCGWCEHTDAVHRICTSFGLEFYPVQASFKPEEINDGDKEFYRRNPSVHLFVTDTRQWVSAIGNCVAYENDAWHIV